MANNQNRLHSIAQDINRWVRSFDFATKTNFFAFKLEGIKFLRNIKINWEIRRATVKFQDIKDHIFQLGTAELFPTIKEFSTILGYKFKIKKSMVVSCDPKHKEILFDALGLSISITSSMIKGHMVNLHAVATSFIHQRTHDIFDNMQKNFSLALCFVGEFLFCSRKLGFTNSRAIRIMNKIKDGDNPASLIMAETLLVLDSIFLGGESQQFLRSPLTLQICLMEIMDIIATPTVSNYGPNNFPNKDIIKTKCQTKNDLVKFLKKKSNILIRWDCYWWKFPPPFLQFKRETKTDGVKRLWKLIN